MTKAARIRALYAEGHTVKMIAEVVGCRQEYVRVCAQQRVGGPSKADRTYQPEKRAREAWRYQNDPDYRARRNANSRDCKRRKRLDPEYRERDNAYMREWNKRKREARA